MTHPALYSMQDTLDALDAALKTADLSILQRQALEEMRADLDYATHFDTFAQLLHCANEAAKRGIL